MMPITVLYVDDDPALLDIAKIFLERTGAFKVATASSAVIALEDLENRSFDIVISDYEMPVMNGIQFLKIFRKKYENVPFILFTGKGREEIVVEALDNGADSYIQKGGDPKAQFHELQHKIKINVEMRKAQKALLDSEKKYRQLFENAQEAVFIIQDEKIAFFNPVFSRMLEHSCISCENFLSAHLMAFIHPEDQGMVRERLQQTTNGETVPVYTFRLMNESGLISWWEVNAIITEWNDRPATLNFARDVSSQYHLSKKIAESESRYREMVEFLPITVIETNEQLILTFINRAGTNTFGYQCSEIQGHLTPRDLVVLEEQEKIIQIYNRARNMEVTLAHETIARKKDGTTFTMKIYVSAIKEGSKITGFRSVCINISDIKKVAEELYRANKKLKLMADIAHHDINNKLTALQGYLELAQTHPPGQNAARYLENSQNIAGLIQAQIEFSQTYNDIGLEPPKWQDLPEIITISEKRLIHETISVRCSIRDLKIYADPFLKSVFQNLVDYSLRYGEHVSTISVSCEKRGNRLVVVYEDNGNGITSSDKPLLFTSGFGKNTGTGLFMVREILSVTGIAITETGESGKGARFEIHIPQGKYRFVTGSPEETAVSQSI